MNWVWYLHCMALRFPGLGGWKSTDVWGIWISIWFVITLGSSVWFDDGHNICSKLNEFYFKRIIENRNTCGNQLQSYCPAPRIHSNCQEPEVADLPGEWLARCSGDELKNVSSEFSCSDMFRPGTLWAMPTNVDPQLLNMQIPFRCFDFFPKITFLVHIERLRVAESHSVCCSLVCVTLYH